MQGSNFADDEPMADMNLIPLIDISLTLVIILMVTTTFIKNPGVALQLPHTVTREGATETVKDLTIAVTANGGFYVDAKPIAPADLQARLMDLGRRNKDARVLIKGDQATAYKNVLTVTDMVRQAKLTKIVFPSLPKEPGEADAPTPAPSPTSTPPATTGSPEAGTPMTSATPPAESTTPAATNALGTNAGGEAAPTGRP